MDTKDYRDLIEQKDPFEPTKAERIEFELSREFAWATVKFPPFNSAHEGYAVILEEVDELWDTIKNNKNSAPLDRAEEALQIAAMAMRFIHDLLPDEGVKMLAHRQREKGR